jgi:hypothetical protein
MLQEEKNKFEERVLAYFDGALDKQSAKQLFEEVTRNAEKRTLFQSHETLNRIISAARIPLETPIEAKRGIVDRIPGLLAFLPGLLGTAETIPVLTQSANPFIAFFTKIPLSTAIAIGASVAVLTTAGVVVKNKLDTDAAREHKSNIAAVQNHVPATTAQRYAMLPDAAISSIPSHDLASPHLGNASSSMVSGLRHSNISSVSKDRFTIENTNAFSSLPAAPTLKGSKNANTISNNENGRSITSITTTPTLATEASNEPPIANINSVSPKQTPAASADIVPPTTSVLYPLSMDLTQGVIVRPFLSMGGRIVTLPSVTNIQPSSLDQNSRTQIASDIRFGLDVLLDEQFAINLQAGQTSFAQLQTERSTLPAPQNGLPFSSNTYYSRVNVTPSLWTMAGASYMVNPNDPFRLILSADAGAAWQLNGIAPMGELGIATELDLSSRLTLRPALTFDVARVGYGSDQSGTPPTNGFIYHNESTNSSNLWESAIGFNIGFMLRY